MNSYLEKDWKEIEELFHTVAQHGKDYIHSLDKRSTYTSHQYSHDVLAEDGVGTTEAFSFFKTHIDPLMVASSGSRYWGFVTGGTTPAGIVGDWLTSIYDQNTQTKCGNGDVSAQIEFATIDMLLDLFDLPKDYTGGFVTGATMSNFTCLGVARQWVGKQLGKDFAKDGITEKINILSANLHSSSVKSLAMLGIGSRNVIKVKMQDGREAIDSKDLEEKISELNGSPFILISSAGTVNTADFDDFKTITQLREKYNFWWHIDAAFGGFAACSPEHKNLVEGWENADSITIDNHKWMNVPYDSAIFLVKENHQLLQAETFQNSNAPYLDATEFNYLNYLPENSRRLRALPAWFMLKAYGKKGVQDIVENSIHIAQYFSQKVEEHPKLTLLSPTRLNNVCFTLQDYDEAKVTEFLTTLNQTGKVFMTPTVYQNKKGIRASFVNWQTQKEDVDLVFEEIDKILN